MDGQYINSGCEQREVVVEQSKLYDNQTAVSECEDMWDEDEESYASDYDMDTYHSQDFFESTAGCSSSAVGSPFTYRYKVLSEQDIREEQSKAINLVVGVMKCDQGLARSLLIYFQWRYEPLMEAWSEYGLEELLTRSGISTNKKDAEQSLDGEGLVCQVCFSTVEEDEMCTMACGHWFCKSCWRYHFKSQIAEGKGCRLTCMYPKCGIITQEDIVQQLLINDTESLEKYKMVLENSFVDSQRSCCWCPSVPHCGAAIMVISDGMEEPVCSCNLKFCFSCQEAAHSPTTCKMWKAWTIKNEDESETANWLAANCKSCPKCGKMVQKNGGCNLVVCVCRQAFCWICGQPTGRAHTWDKIEGHECGRYKEEQDENVTEAKRSLDRYLHYFNRFKLHQSSCEKEADLRTALINSTEALLKLDVSPPIQQQDIAWIKGTLETLFEARRIISNSYALAFYVFNYQYIVSEYELAKKQGSCTVVLADQNTWLIKQVLFEDQQQMLEQAVERLSGLLQEFLNQEQKTLEYISQTQYSSMNLARTIHMRLKNMYQVVEDELLPQLGDGESQIAQYSQIQL